MEKQDPSKKSDLSTWRTSDLYLCGFLKARGLNFIRIEHEPHGRRVFFIFENSRRLDELTRAFYSDEAIGALTYKGIIKNLKEIIFAESER
jgi:hypothetical protein